MQTPSNFAPCVRCGRATLTPNECPICTLKRQAAAAFAAYDAEIARIFSTLK